MEVGLTICEILPASIAEVFDRLDDGKINFDSLENMVLMVETRKGARFKGLVARGKDNQFVLYTANECFPSEGEKEDYSIDGYVLPLEGRDYRVLSNADEDSQFKYLLSTEDLGPLDLVEDRTIFDKRLSKILGR